METQRLIVHSGIIQMDTGTVLRRDGRTARLTPIERRLLSHLVTRAEQAIGRDELYREVWGHTRRLNTRTLDVAVSRLRHKIEIDARSPRNLLTSQGQGYRFTLSHDAQPSAPGPFVGREKELAALKTWLSAGANAPSLWMHGVAGVGKSRLVKELAALAEGMGYRVIHLEGNAGFDRAISMIAASLTHRTAPQTLVVVDADEGLTERRHGVLRALGAHQADFRLIVAARDRGRPHGWESMELKGLSTSEAHILFESLGLGLEATDLYATERIATLMDGNPGVLRKLASRLSTNRPSEVVRWVEADFAAIDTGSAPTSPYSALDREWSSLAIPLREAVAKLVALRGPVSFEDAEAALGSAEATALLAELRNRSLVSLDEAGTLTVPAVVAGYARSRSIPVPMPTTAFNHSRSTVPAADEGAIPLGWHLWQTGDLRRADQWLENARRETAVDALAGDLIDAWRAGIALEGGNVHEAQKLAQDVRARTAPSEASRDAAMVLGMVASLRASWSTARTWFDEAARLGRSASVTSQPWHFRALTSMTRACAGESEPAEIGILAIPELEGQAMRQILAMACALGRGENVSVRQVRELERLLARPETTSFVARWAWMLCNAHFGDQLGRGEAPVSVSA